MIALREAVTSVAPVASKPVIFVPAGQRGMPPGMPTIDLQFGTRFVEGIERSPNVGNAERTNTSARMPTPRFEPQLKNWSIPDNQRDAAVKFSTINCKRVKPIASRT